MSRRVRVLLVLLASSAAVAVLPLTASAHRSGCHAAHTCPSDHHSYVWFDASGAGWDCAEPGAPEYDATRDLTTIVNAGLRYLCRAAGAAPSPTVPVPAPAPTLPTAACHARGALPDRGCTPGVVLHVTAKQVCRRGYATRARDVTQGTKTKVFAAYGITSHPTGAYEVDHLISLELGGSNSIRNLFPEAAQPRPGFHEKDRLENALHRRVCSGEMTLRAAQHAIATNWVTAWHRFG